MTSFVDRARMPGSAQTGAGGNRVHRSQRHVPRPPWAAIQRMERSRSASAGEQSGPAPATAPNRTGLPDRLKAGVEAQSGLAMDDVRVHRNSPEPAKLGALAYTKGSGIHLGPGQEKHLAHEAWHVVQQKQGRVGVTTQLKGVAVNADAGLEAEADRMGIRIDTAGAVAALDRDAAIVRPVLQLQRFEAEPKHPPGNIWTDGDFVHHFYFGHGAAVNLGNIGLGDTFRNHPSVREQIAEFISFVLSQPDAKGVISSPGETNVTDKIFSVGGPFIG